MRKMRPTSATNNPSEPAPRGARVTSRTIRPDYKLHTELTLGEAGLIAGVGPQAVRVWLRERRVRRARKIGPFMVDHHSLLEYLQSGEGQA